MRLHLVDGTFELFRAHYSKRPDRVDGAGRDVKATVGVVAGLLALLSDEEEAVTSVAVAFDNPIESFRNDAFAGYKDGSEVDPALLAQFDLVEEAVRALGVVVWSMDRWEADDALATAALRFVDDVDQVRILTPDKDLGQVVRGDRIVQVDRMRQHTYDEAGVHARFGIRPVSVPDYLGLVGDTADGIPGLAGFGAKSAAAVLDRYVHIEDVPARAEDWDVAVRGAARLAATLDEQREQALFYRSLATLVPDVPLAEDLDALAWGGVPRGPFLAVCERLDATTLRDVPARWA
ncbi:MAG: flap endonuclease [Actinobacteria bacterium]|nr:flap endonuclease [Actinomycetota bacterium]